MRVKKLVTRSVTITTIEYLAVDIQNQITYTDKYNAPLEITTIKDAEKYLAGIINNDKLKLVNVTGLQAREKLYGMTEEDFVKVARPMRSRYSFVKEENEKKEGKENVRN